MNDTPQDFKDRLDGYTVGMLIDLLQAIAAELDSRGLPECAGYVESASDRLWTRYAGIPRPAATESRQDATSQGGPLSHPGGKEGK